MKIFAVDYGDSRTGLATCDRTEFLTTAITPQITLKARNKVAARVCEVAKEIEAGDTVEIDFDSGVIVDKTKGTQYQGQAFPPFMQKIIKAEGLVNYINSNYAE